MRFLNSIASALLWFGVTIALSPLVLLLSVVMGAAGDWAFRAALLSSMLSAPLTCFYFFRLCPIPDYRVQGIAAMGVLLARIKLVRRCTAIQLIVFPFVFILLPLCLPLLAEFLVIIWFLALILFVVAALISLIVRAITKCPACGGNGMGYHVAFDRASCCCNSCGTTWIWNAAK